MSASVDALFKLVSTLVDALSKLVSCAVVTLFSPVGTSVATLFKLAKTRLLQCWNLWAFWLFLCSNWETFNLVRCSNWWAPRVVRCLPLPHAAQITSFRCTNGHAAMEESELFVLMLWLKLFCWICAFLVFAMYVNLLKPTGYVMYQQVLIFKSCKFCPQCFDVSYLSQEQTVTSASYNINWLVFITEMKSVYSAVRTGSLNKAVCGSSLEG